MPTFHLNINGERRASAEIDERGKRTTVKKNSRAVAEGTESTGLYARRRQELISQRVLIRDPEDEKLLILTEDYAFPSASQAAGVLRGHTAGALDLWRTDDDRTLRTVLAQRARGDADDEEMDEES